MNTLHIVTGPPAAGKTVYGKALASRVRATYLDIDTVTEPVVRAGLQLADLDPYDRDSPVFKDSFRSPIYDTLFSIARENLTHTDVVIVGPFTSEIRDPGWLESTKKRCGSPVQVHYVTCSPEQRRQRMKERANPRDASKLADWENHLAYYGEESPPPFEHQFVDTSE